MFYLINEKDGLMGESVLVNTSNLTYIEVTTNSDEFTLVFTYENDKQKFTFNQNEIFDVTKVMENITNLIEPVYNNSFIVLKDVENIDSLSKIFGKNSKIINKINSLLFNINEIGLVYTGDNGTVLTTNKKDFSIKESPMEVLEIINEKIISNEIKPRIEIKNRI